MARYTTSTITKIRPLREFKFNPITFCYYELILHIQACNILSVYRYLTFFDDGYAQYCRHTEVHRVYEQSRNVWEDIHPDSQEFIKGYLQQYPEVCSLRVDIFVLSWVITAEFSHLCIRFPTHVLTWNRKYMYCILKLLSCVLICLSEARLTEFSHVPSK